MYVASTLDPVEEDAGWTVEAEAACACFPWDHVPVVDAVDPAAPPAPVDTADFEIAERSTKSGTKTLLMI